MVFWIILIDQLRKR